MKGSSQALDREVRFAAPVPVVQKQENVAVQVFSPHGSMALEHARQSAWEQSVVGVLCAVGGSLLAYWSMQGVIGLVVIALCVIFSTLVTAALCHYYDHSVRSADDGRAGQPVRSGSFSYATGGRG